MTKINTVANNGLTIVENYNKLLEQFRKTKTIDDVRILVASAKDFISVYKRVDKNMVNEIYDKLQSKLQDMVAENAFVYDRMNNRVEEIRNRGYDYANEQDDTQAVQSKALQLMSQMPKVMNSNHANRITKVLTDSINSGVIGSKAVLELLKYPAYADMVSAKINHKNARCHAGYAALRSSACCPQKSVPHPAFHRRRHIAAGAASCGCVMRPAPAFPYPMLFATY